MDRVTHFAVAAAKLAIEDAKLDMSKENPLRCGVCVGSGIGGIHTFLEQSLKLGSKGPSKISRSSFRWKSRTCLQARLLLQPV